MDAKFYLLLFIWALFALFSIHLGVYSLSPKEIFYVFLGKSDEITKSVVIDIRLVRVLTSSLCGGILGLCGICLQAIFKNPLVEPKIIGISTSCAFGGCLAILFGLSGVYLIGLSFVFGILSLLFLYFIAGFVKESSIFTLILAGIVVNGFFAALISLTQYLADNEEVLPNIVFWLLGSFVAVGFDKFILLFCISMPCVILLFMMRWRLNILSLSEFELKTLKIKAVKLRYLIIALCTLLIAAQVSISGNIGWIGLVVPHITRLVGSTNHLKSVPESFLVGMIFMLFIDNLARTLTQNEIPLSILSALIGTPVFAYLLYKNKNHVR